MKQWQRLKMMMMMIMFLVAFGTEVEGCRATEKAAVVGTGCVIVSVCFFPIMFFSHITFFAS
ncbi:hypothetical protein HanRHA438_Chr07g0310321 [Helianthus annuus]|nr:hypothetical protein HanRHA438_Chr07g0310321 [Helianthus annuus]